MDKSLLNKCDTKGVCRICLKRSASFTDLFSEGEESKKILEMLYLCFQIILNEETYLPSIICACCTAELIMANNFRVKCITFEERFNVYCKQTTENVIPDAIAGYKGESYDDSNQTINEAYENVDSDLDNNIMKTANKPKEIFKCDNCDKILSTKKALLKHIVSMHEKRKHIGKVTGSGISRRYHCTKCAYSTPHSQTLVNHIRRHNGERPFHCYCGKSFTQASSLTAHQKTHSDNKFFTCSICGKQFKHAFTLKNHLQTHQPGSYACNICQKVLKSQKSLQVHLHRHYDIRNYSCEECGATFVSCSDLLNHRKIHNSEKKEECHLCNYKTRAKKNLIMHLKRHAGNKPFKCELCDVTVYTSSDLRRHQRVHTREKPFVCPKCSQRFAHSPSLNKHVRNVHGIQYSWVNHKPVSKKSSIKDEM